MMKTSDVAKELGINPKTVLKWVKQHDIPCEKNELGHFEFTDQHLEQLKQVQSNSPSQRVTSTTVPKREGTVSLSIEKTEKWQEIQKQIDQLSLRLRENERRTEEKAGEVVTFQILEHRSEIDDLQKKVEKLEARIQELEEKKQTESSLSHLPQKRTSRWRAFLTNLL